MDIDKEMILDLFMSRFLNIDRDGYKLLQKIIVAKKKVSFWIDKSIAKNLRQHSTALKTTAYEPNKAMLPVARQFSNRWWRRRPHIGLSHTPIIKLNFHSLPQTKVEEELDDFLPWLERKSGTEISSALFIGKSTHGRSLFASKSIRAGDCILKVPYSVQLAPDNLPPELESLLGDQVGDVAKVAIVILFEQKMGHDSKWAPYISRLPHPEQMHSTIFWSEDELEMIRQSSLYQETIDLRSLVEKEFLAIRKLLLEHGEAERVIP